MGALYPVSPQSRVLEVPVPCGRRANLSRDSTCFGCFTSGKGGYDWIFFPFDRPSNIIFPQEQKRRKIFTEKNNGFEYYVANEQ